MALRRGFAGLVPRLLNSPEALAPICTSSSSLLQAETSSSSSGNHWGAYQSFLRGGWASWDAAQSTDPTSLGNRLSSPVARAIAGYASDVATLKPSGLSPTDKLGRTPNHNIA